MDSVFMYCCWDISAELGEIYRWDGKGSAKGDGVEGVKAEKQSVF